MIYFFLFNLDSILNLKNEFVFNNNFFLFIFFFFYLYIIFDYFLYKIEITDLYRAVLGIKMRKDDILSQKLLEVYTLSQFYLARVMNCENNGDSPFMLASAYKKKLNEIVDRYDKMKDVRQQLSSSSLAAEEKKLKRRSRQIHRDSYSRSSTPTRSPVAARMTSSASVSPSTSFASIKQFYEQNQQLDELNTSLNGKYFILIYLI